MCPAQKGESVVRSRTEKTRSRLQLRLVEVDTGENPGQGPLLHAEIPRVSRKIEPGRPHGPDLRRKRIPSQ
jgi:hypothetical protein